MGKKLKAIVDDNESSAITRVTGYIKSAINIFLPSNDCIIIF